MAKGHRLMVAHVRIPLSINLLKKIFISAPYVEAGTARYS